MQQETATGFRGLARLLFLDRTGSLRLAAGFTTNAEALVGAFLSPLTAMQMPMRGLGLSTASNQESALAREWRLLDSNRHHEVCYRPSEVTRQIKRGRLVELMALPTKARVAAGAPKHETRCSRASDNARLRKSEAR
jgi:hypothetical protein